MNRQRAQSGREHRGRRGKPSPVGLRIIGGRFRGRKLAYSGDRRVRPMKDRIREAVFNLIGPDVVGKHAIDLFAGTGALALEALSRGAARATLIEQHRPTVRLAMANVRALGVESLCRLVEGDVFVWHRRGPPLGPTPWLVFCSPPYDFYTHRLDDMLQLLGGLIASAPAESVFVVEADRRFDWSCLPHP
ncbi:MAG TPA: SAM-dependent methyltransferase, partial [Planctomycetaceae bacterium]|nr:SAM-dependent methyltransferase [Planctomycetaceae bacterium]